MGTDGSKDKVGRLIQKLKCYPFVYPIYFTEAKFSIGRWLVMARRLSVV